jgi:hypothetical protein
MCEKTKGLESIINGDVTQERWDVSIPKGGDAG